MECVDVLVVGAGLLGCFAARALSKWELQTVVIERREDVCTGISRANTGIIYTGCDTRPNTLKTALCVSANLGFDELCRQLDVPFRRCGSIMVAFGPRAEEKLRKKYENGMRNGVPGLRLLDAEQVLQLEPGLAPCVRMGLYAPGTGTVNPWELGISAFENAQANGSCFHFCETVRAIHRCDDGFVVESDRGTYLSRAVLNCAGLASDQIRELLESPKVRIFPSRGDYLVLASDACRSLTHIIFHEPETKEKGLTLVPTVDGNILIGPTERNSEREAPFSTSREDMERLQTLCRTVFPTLPLDQVIRNFSAMRPNPYLVTPMEKGVRREEKRISDFTIMEETGLFSLIGIKTPGLTCAAELGDYIAGKIVNYLGDVSRNDAFSPIRYAIPRVRELPLAERAALIRQDPAYGRVLCYCREITEGEIRDAIIRGAVSVDGVKRRVGTGSGRCQGSRCTQSIMELLARELHRPVPSILKDASGSWILRGGANHEAL